MASLETIPEIISLAHRSNLESVADWLEYLYKLDRDNVEEPINHDTVYMLVSFMIEHPDLATDAIRGWYRIDLMHNQYFINSYKELQLQMVFFVPVINHLKVKN